MASSSSSSVAKKTKGKQKIQIARIENPSDRLVKFSKRKSGLYKKVSELIVLTGCQIAVLMYSPAGKAYSFGHPCIYQVAKQFLNGSPAADHDYSIQAMIEELNQTRNESLKQIEESQVKQKALESKLQGIPKTTNYWSCRVEDASLQQLLEMESAFMEVLAKVEMRMSEIEKSTANLLQ